jgi:hypothetical protein
LTWEKYPIAELQSCMYISSLIPFSFLFCLEVFHVNNAAVLQAVGKFFAEKTANLVRKKRGDLVLLEPKGKPIILKPATAYSLLFKALDKIDRTAFNKEFAEYLEDFSDSTFPPYIHKAVAEALIGTDKDEGRPDKAMASKCPSRAPGEIYFNDTIQTPISKLKLIYNVKDRRHSFLYDETKDITHMYDFDFIMMRLKHLLGDNTQDWVESNSEDCVLEYRPFAPRIFPDIEAESKVFNTWIEAPWRKDWDISIEPYEIERPEPVAKYLRAFTRDEQDAHELSAWLRDCVFGRAEPILVLCGLPGVGKNIFIENICGGMVGRNNYRQASRGFHKTQFHNNVSSCRLFFLDEMNLTPEARETLKAYHNGTATIERKGKDVGDPEKIWASFAIANNHKQKISLEYTDRKFFVPRLSEKPLLDSMTQADIDELIAFMVSPQKIRSYAAHLWHTYPAGSSIRFRKNEFFKELCINSYPHFFRRLHALLMMMPEVTHKKFGKGLGRNGGAEFFEIRDTLVHFESNFGLKIAELFVEANGGWTAKSLIFKDENIGKQYSSVNDLNGLLVEMGIGGPSL